MTNNWTLNIEVHPQYGQNLTYKTSLTKPHLQNPYSQKHFTLYYPRIVG